MRKGSVPCMLLSAVLAAGSVSMGSPITVLAAEQEDIVVLYTNDVHCGVDDNIGYAGLALYEKQMLEKTPYVTLVDAGDAVQGAPIGTLSDGAYLVDIMNKLGYDVAIPGNHEFDYGMERFLEISEDLDCGYVSSNFMDVREGQPVFAPYKMITYGETDVAYVGVTTPETFTKSTPAYFQDAEGNYIYSFSEDEDGTALYEQVQRAVDAARADGAEYVILMSHLGVNGVTERWSSTAVLENTVGIDACIDGHSHEAIPTMVVKNQNAEDVVLTQTGTKLAAIGQLTIGSDGTIETTLIEKVEAPQAETSYVVQKGDTLSRLAKRNLGSYNRWPEIYACNKAKLSNPDLLTIGMELLIPSGHVVTEDGRVMDGQVDQFVKKIQSEYNQSLKVVLGTSDYLLTVNDPETGERKVRNGETNLGDFSADAYRFVLGAEIGFSNGGGIRADIEQGQITYEDILNVFPYGNMACMIEVTGQQIKDALELAVMGMPEEGGGFLQVSGMSYTIDTSVPSSVKVDDKGNFVSVEGEYRVKELLVDGEPLDLAKTYTLASHNYLLKAGGNGMTMFSGSKVLKDEVMVDVDVLSAYLEILGGCVSEAYADPNGQGRIVVK